MRMGSVGCTTYTVIGGGTIHSTKRSTSQQTMSVTCPIRVSLLRASIVVSSLLQVVLERGSAVNLRYSAADVSGFQSVAHVHLLLRRQQACYQTNKKERDFCIALPSVGEGKEQSLQSMMCSSYGGTRQESPAIDSSKICIRDYKRATGTNEGIEGRGERRLRVYVVRQHTGCDNSFVEDQVKNGDDGEREGE